MIVTLFDDIISYVFSLNKYLNDLFSNKRRVELIGLLGLTFSFLSYIILAGSLEIGLWLSVINLIVGVVYALLVIGTALVLSKVTELHPAQVFWFIFSVGIFDSIIILFIVFKFLYPPLFTLILLSVIILKIYYLIKGTSVVFNVSKSTSFIILISPYILVLIIFLISLIITYISLYRELYTIFSSVIL